MKKLHSIVTSRQALNAENMKSALTFTSQQAKSICLHNTKQYLLAMTSALRCNSTHISFSFFSLLTPHQPSQHLLGTAEFTVGNASPPAQSIASKELSASKRNCTSKPQGSAGYKFITTKKTQVSSMYKRERAGPALNRVSRSAT